MSDQTPEPGGKLPLDAARRLDAACNRFEAAWQEPTPPRVEDFLDSWEGTERQALVRELVALDIDFRRARGQVLQPEMYLGRFPELALAFLTDALFGVAEAPPSERSTAPVEARTNGSGLATVDGPRTTRPAPARVVRYFGDYELMDELGHGAMGIVYLAWQVSLDRPVAVKMILAGELATEAQVQRFHTEAQNAAGLDHPHIVPIYEVGEHEGQCFFSMKLIEGTSLDHKIDAYTADPRKAAGLLATVARAVHHAHQRGVLHRDLKPGNILLDAQGQPHVADFGLAKRIDGKAGLSQSGAIVGTPCYMAPEQAAGDNRRLTTAADVYALGAVLYECLTGRPPFHGDTVLKTLLRVQYEEPVPPGKVHRGLSRDLDTICLTCLQKDPQKRYASAEELAVDLGLFLEDKPIKRRPVSTFERAVRWVRRRPAQAALVGISFLAILSLVGLAVGLYYNAELGSINNELKLTVGKLKEKQEEADRLRGIAVTAEEHAHEQESLARRILYASQMQLASQAVDEKKYGYALSLLDKLRPERPDQEDLRGPEWHHLWGRCGGSQFSMRGHEAAPTALRVSHDGKLIASADVEGVIKLWDGTTGKELQTLRGHKGEVPSLVFDRADRRLASAGHDGTVRLWDVSTGRELACYREHQDKVLCVAFNPTGEVLASSGQDKQVILCDASGTGSGRLLGTAARPVKALAFFEDSIIAVSDDVRTVRTSVWDWQKCMLAAPNNSWRVTIAAGQVAMCDGCMPGIVTAACLLTANGSLQSSSWYLEKESRLFLSNSAIIRCVNLSDDGRYLFVGGVTQEKNRQDGRKGTLAVWDVHSGVSLIALATLESPVVCACISSDGRLIATGDLNLQIKVRDVVTSKELATINSPARANAVAFHPEDGLRIVSAAEDQTVRVWQTGAAAIEVGKLVNNAVFTADSRCIVTSGWVGMWDTFTREQVSIPSLPTNVGGMSSRVAISPNGRFLCAGQTLINMATGEQQTFRVGGGNIYIPAFSPDSKLLVMGNNGKAATVYELPTLRVLHRLESPGSWNTGVAFSPDGKYVAVGNSVQFERDGANGGLVVQIWEVNSWRLVRTLERNDYSTWDLAFSPNGRYLAAACGQYTPTVTGTGEVKVWEVATGRVVANLRRCQECVWSVAFSPDGRHLAATSGNYNARKGGGEVRIWDISTWQEVMSLRDHKDDTVFSVAYSPDGRRMVTVCRGGTIRIWGPGTPVD